MSWAEADKTPTLGKMFSEEMGPKLWRPPRARRRPPSSSDIATWLPRCRRVWKKFISEC